MGALDVDVADYQAFAQRLKAADRKVASGLRKRVRDAAKPLAEAVVQDGPEGLPERGGLADWLREAKPGLSMTQTRVAISLGAGHDLASINRGKLRHPVFARDTMSKREASAVAGEVVAAAAALGKKVKGGKAGVARKVRKAGWAWVNQLVEAGTYDKAIDKHAEAALGDIAQALDDVMREI